MSVISRRTDAQLVQHIVDWILGEETYNDLLQAYARNLKKHKAKGLYSRTRALEGLERIAAGAKAEMKKKGIYHLELKAPERKLAAEELLNVCETWNNEAPSHPQLALNPLKYPSQSEAFTFDELPEDAQESAIEQFKNSHECDDFVKSYFRDHGIIFNRKGYQI